MRSTLDRLQRSEELAPDDPALAELKGSVLSKIVELEVAKAPEPPEVPTRILWISNKAREHVQLDANPESPEGPAPPEGPASEDLQHDVVK